VYVQLFGTYIIVESLDFYSILQSEVQSIMTSSTNTIVCINDSIVKAASYCLNESVSKQYYNILEINNNNINDTSSSLLLKSDVDSQLLIHLSLLQTFKLSTIIIGIPGNSTCPSIIKLYANQGNVSFSDVSGNVKV
jgi:hypothetical protein